MVFIYKDNSKAVWDKDQCQYVGPIVFVTQANSIDEADKAFKLATGIEAFKHKSIGCMIG